MRVTRSFFDSALSAGLVFNCGYCEIPALENQVRADVYNAGTYGWNYDGYSIGKYWILSGYRNMPGRKIPTAVIDAIDAKAAKAASPEEIEAIIYDALAALN